ncbi:hypothetical protein FDP41_000073 [Naegleria fowleri]|uniref:Uncharacterized protein n=1 Tax=Naegleria fowleri TaxID=5763 RepID=A0A6A5CEL9_NAEFO|nr:uncharacterized protein FDP41_000073 [Naegleria fowleri]KAF0985034.1 hypothetical protein FDP41_000073 [Naegleria fowleri]CAG4712207.1 unnamed protein product [Naegleria fowleri]
MYKKLITASTKPFSLVSSFPTSLQTHISKANPLVAISAASSSSQQRNKKSSKEQKSKDAKWMRQAGVFKYKKPKYQMKKADTDDIPIFRLFDEAKATIREEDQWDAVLYNNEQIPKEGETELRPITENSFYKLINKYTREELENMSIGEMDRELDDPNWDAFEYHLSLSQNQKDDIAFQLANELLPGLMQTPREILLPHVSDLEPHFENDFSKLPKNHSDRKVIEGRLVTDEYLKQVHEHYGKPGESPEETFAALRLYEEALSYEKNEYEQEKELAEKVRQEQNKIKHVKRDDLDRMFELHKKDPAYWTGERLALEFGITREQAWCSLLLREWDEAERTGKPFSFDKAKIIFSEDIRRSDKEDRDRKKGQATPKILTHQITEEEAYKRFLEESSKPMNTASDDNLPDYVKYPFQEYVIGEQESKKVEVIEKEVENKTGFGSDVSRYKLYVAEMKKKFDDERARRFMVSEEDGTLRTMSESELAFMHRHKTFPKTREGLGGKQKRKNLRRKREF